MAIGQRRSRRRSVVRLALRVSSILLTLWSALWLATGDSFTAVRFGLYLAPLIMGVAAALSILGLFFGSRLSVLIHAGVAGLLFAFLPATFVRAPVAVADRPDALSVMTLSNRTLNRDMATTADLIRRDPADLILLQEVAEPQVLLSLLIGLYRDGQSPAACQLGTYLIVSRHPVGPVHAGSDGTWLLCPLSLPGGQVWVASIHLPKSLGSTDQQDAAVTDILDVLRPLKEPVILGGDLNATPLTSPVARLSRQFTNAFDAVGAGAGFTFPTAARRLGTLGAFARIDHIYHSRAFLPVTAGVASWHPPEADHYPLRAVLAHRGVGF